MLEQCCNHWKQCRNNVATLCCTKNRRCVDTKGWAGLVPEASVFPTAISVSGLKLLSYEHFSPVTGMKARWNLGWHRFVTYACCIFHIISISFNYSDTTLRVTKAMIGAKVIILVFRHFCFISQISRRNSSTGLLALSSRNPGWKFPYEPKAKLFPQTRSAQSIRLTWRGPKPIAFITVLVAVAVAVAVVVAQAPYWDVVGSSG